MDHEFRKIREGLIEIGTVSLRVQRDEFKVIIDEYAAEAVFKFVPSTMLSQLQGWARSVYSLDQHVDAILAYRRQKLPEPTDDVWNQTKQHTLQLFRRFPKITPISYKSFDEVKWISSSSAGYGYVGHKGDGDNYLKARRTAVTIAEKLDHDRNYAPEAINQSTPDVAFTRTQLSQVKVKTKVRNVWGEAFHYVLLEGLFADPLINFFSNEESFYFIGRNPLLSVPTLIEEIFKSKDYVYAFDWSGFDASVQEWEIRFAFQCLESQLIFPSNVEAQIWRFIVELFIYRKIAAPNGTLFLKTLGIPSGSCFTNMIGSVVNYVRIQYMFKKLTDDFVEAYTHGDDSLAAVSTAQYIPLEKFGPICEPFMWSINTLKSEVSREGRLTTFLSRSIRDKQNYRDEFVCLRMLVYPEYEVEDGSISALRAKSIYVDAGIHSQYLYHVFLYLKQKYGLANTLPHNLRTWDPTEHEALRASYSNIM
ncbi:putative RNA dependent RNA polymerse [Raphanus sativus cryptic virus 2]|uniref:putative RNA dependent RNA polymerse n=1 Tax=Raphanus sativus cryptic virus 2 TaxID=351495 RepID=UPI00005D3910|nr:putative RNA dependent RNA polymerse [Raphanus sativus cryptic virus 2]ABB04855.1 putative RNA dependent RNA polymerse [Raphanus sativus cryptic virus 2]